jgi:hypothetical protein
MFYASDSSLAQFQTETLGQFSTLTGNFDNMVSDQKCDDGQIVHAFAEDGTAVPLTLDHETGQVKGKSSTLKQK